MPLQRAREDHPRLIDPTITIIAVSPVLRRVDQLQVLARAITGQRSSLADDQKSEPQDLDRLIF